MTGPGVVWDMDGVLVDTGEFHFQSWAEVLAAYDIPFSREFFGDTFGMNNKGILSLLLGEKLTPELLAEIGDRKEEQFRRAVRGRVRPLPGVLDWLERLQGAGFRQGLASSAPKANIDTLVDGLGIRGYFAAIESGVNLPGKPEPILFLKVAGLLGVSPERCVVVEDAVAGVEAARRAGGNASPLRRRTQPRRWQRQTLLSDGWTPSPWIHSSACWQGASHLRPEARGAQSDA